MFRARLSDRSAVWSPAHASVDRVEALRALDIRCLMKNSMIVKQRECIEQARKRRCAVEEKWAEVGRGAKAHWRFPSNSMGGDVEPTGLVAAGRRRSTPFSSLPGFDRHGSLTDLVMPHHVAEPLQKLGRHAHVAQKGSNHPTRPFCRTLQWLQKSLATVVFLASAVLTRAQGVLTGRIRRCRRSLV